MKFLNKTIYLIPLLVLLSSGCATQQPYDYTSLLESKPRSIVVIPPINNSLEPEAPYVYLSTITRPLAEKGYYVFPVSMVDHFMKANGLPTPDEMNAVALDKIAENIGADAVLYATIDRWGQNYQITASVAEVDVKLKLVDVKTGTVLWNTHAYARQSSGDVGGGLGGALLGALITQVLSDSIDHTPQLSRIANNNAINNAVNGLFSGPYVVVNKGL